MSSTSKKPALQKSQVSSHGQPAKSPDSNNNRSNHPKSLLNEDDKKALQALCKSLSEVNLNNIDKLSSVIREQFWPQNETDAIPLLDAISKLNPKIQNKISEEHFNQANRQRRLRWTQADLVYCLAFQIPNKKDYYLAKVGMTATTGEYSEKDNQTRSRFEKLYSTYANQLSKSELGPMDLQKSQPTFKFLVNPYNTEDLQDIECRIRRLLGWPVLQSVMTKCKLSVPTEWIIIPPTQAKYLYETVRSRNESRSFEFLDTRLFNNFPQLPDEEKVTEFQWTNQMTNAEVRFTPFKVETSEVSSRRMNNPNNTTTSNVGNSDTMGLDPLNISPPSTPASSPKKNPQTHKSKVGTTQHLKKR